MVTSLSGAIVVEPEVLTFNLAARRPKNGWFWIAAAMGMFIASYVIPALSFVESEAGWRFFLCALSVVLLVIGIGILTIRQGVRLDKRNNTVHEWNGVPPFLRTRTTSLDKIVEVKIERVVFRSSQGTPHVIHSVKLTGPEPHVLVWSDKEYTDTRVKAEQVAAFLGVPLRDEALSPIYREDATAIEARAPDMLDASLQQQAAASGEPTPFPVKPSDCRIRVRREPSCYVFGLPPLRRSLAIPFGVAFCSLGVAVVLALMVMRHTEPEDPIAARILLWSMPAAVGFVGPAFAIGRGINRYTQNENITITPLALSREVRQRWTQHTVEVPIELIEEFGYTPMAAAWTRSLDAGRHENLPMASTAISVRTDFKRIYLGQGLRRSEQVWLHDVLKYLLTHTASGEQQKQNSSRADR